MNAIILALVIGQPQSPSLPQAPPVRPVFSQAMYDKACKMSREDRCPLIIMVGMSGRVNPKAGYRAILCHLSVLNDDTTPRIVIAFPDGDFQRTYGLPATATDAEIEYAARFPARFNAVSAASSVVNCST